MLGVVGSIGRARPDGRFLPTSARTPRVHKVFHSLQNPQIGPGDALLGPLFRRCALLRQILKARRIVDKRQLELADRPVPLFGHDDFSPPP